MANTSNKITIQPTSYRLHVALQVLLKFSTLSARRSLEKLEQEHIVRKHFLKIYNFQERNNLWRRPPTREQSSLIVTLHLRMIIELN